MNTQRTCKDCVNKKGRDITLLLNAEAMEKKTRGERVVNATIGMLFDEEGQTVSPTYIDEYLKNSINLTTKRYGSTTGDKGALENMFKWAVGPYYDQINKSMLHSYVFTPGGSGALSIALRTYVSLNEKVLMPSICWANYQMMATQRNCIPEFYEIFDGEGKFNIKDLLDKTRRNLEEQGSILIFINDPCENPTGYAISKEEWKEVIKGLNELSSLGSITLLLDIAYIDMGYEDSRLFFSMIDQLNEKILTLVVFSASKTLGIYGLRGGALICIGKCKDDIEEFNLITADAARAIWSAPNGPLIAALKDIYAEDNLPLLRSHIDYCKDIIVKRGELLTSLLAEANIKSLPYKAGFFLVIPVNDSQEVARKLREYNVYVLPLAGNYIRIALCSMQLNDIGYLVESLKKVL